MIKVAKIIIGSRVWKFKGSFYDFTISNIKKYMDIHKRVEELELKYTNKITELELANKLNDVLYEDSILSELDILLRAERVDMLCLMSQKPDKLRKFLEVKEGVTYGVIREALAALFKHYGEFTDFWNQCPFVESFKIKIKGKLLFQKFKVHDMDSTTLLRETLASYQAQKALNHKVQLDSGSWDCICKFIAILVRPVGQMEEIGFNVGSFLNGKKLRGLSFADKLVYYKEKLDQSWEKLAPQLENLKAGIAIGIIKMYFKKKTK